jgi:hypothetical protein
VWKSFLVLTGARALRLSRCGADGVAQAAALTQLGTQSCSNCAGDYEDPDRSALPDESPDEWEGDDLSETSEKEAGDARSRNRPGRAELGENVPE